MNKPTDRADVYTDVTNKLIAALEQGPEAWIKSWTSRADIFRPVNHTTGRPYRGINTLLLALACEERVARENRWLTFRQALANKTPIRKGSKGTPVVFWKVLDAKGRVDEATETESQTKGPIIAKTFYVFNVADCEGHETSANTAPKDNELAARIVEASGARIISGRPCYRPSDDLVQLPSADSFETIDDYWATAFHELAHWTAPRVKRETNAKRFGDHAYAMEELTAELTAAMVCGACAINTLMQSASYLNDWLHVLRADKRALFSVASAAQIAADYLLKAAGVDAIAASDEQAA